MLVFLLAAAMAASGPVAPTSSAVPGPALGLSAGHVGVFDDLEDPAIASVEYRFAACGWRFMPAVGIAAAANGASFIYADMHYEWWISERWVISPSFGVGRFGGGDDLDLGNFVEFRTGMEIAWRFDAGWRIGLVLHHFSNGGISERNPGVEELALTLRVPLAD